MRNLEKGLRVVYEKCLGYKIMQQPTSAQLMVIWLVGYTGNYKVLASTPPNIERTPPNIERTPPNIECPFALTHSCTFSKKNFISLLIFFYFTNVFKVRLRGDKPLLPVKLFRSKIRGGRQPSFIPYPLNHAQVQDMQPSNAAPPPEAPLMETQLPVELDDLVMDTVLEEEPFLTLLNFKALSPVNCKFQVHIVPRDDPDKPSKNYVAVVLFARDFVDGCSFVCCCSVCASSHYLRMLTPDYCSVISSFNSFSCNHEKMALQHACKNMNIPFSTGVLKSLANCCTLEPTKTLGFWAAGSLHKLQSQVYAYISDESLIALFEKRTHAWYCHLCKTYSCVHKKSVVEFPDVDGSVPAQKNIIDPSSDLLRNVLFSKQRYSFIDPIFWRTITQRNGSFVPYLNSHFTVNSAGNFVITPEIKTCRCGQTLQLSTSLQKCLIVGPVIVLNVEICYSWCINDDCKNLPSIHFDGKQHGFINYRDKLIMCAGVAKEYLEIYSNGGTAFYTWWRAKYAVFLDAIDDENEVEILQKWFNELRSHISQCIVGFAELLDYPENLLGCCEKPKMITMDGIVLSVKNLKIPEFQEPWITEKVGFRAGLREERSLILKEYETAVARDLVSARPVSYQVCNNMSHTSHAGLALVCQIVLVECAGCETVVLPKHLLKFLKCFLKKVNPAIRMVPDFMHQDVAQLLMFPELLHENVFVRMMKFSPLLLNVVEAARKCGASAAVIEKVRNFVQVLLDCSRKTYDGVADLRVDETVTDCAEFYSEYASNNISSVWATGHSFPLYPPKCKLPEVCIQQEQAVETCNKTYHQKGSCGAGLVPFWCLEHRKCIGWIVLDSAESPRVISNAILTRFPDAEVVMYDNACRLHEYTLNRFPGAVKNMQFMIDSLHWVNHTSCAEVYNPDNYRAQIGNMPSVLCEQKNSILHRLKTTAPHLNFRSFVALLFYALVSLNRDQEKRNNSK
jgi:CxC4 like cysteine cluster associated with KDZ transposases